MTKEDLLLKKEKFLVKIRDIHKINKKNYYENKVKDPILASRNNFKRQLDLLLIGKGIRYYVLIKDLPYSCIIHYIVEENIFVIIVYKLLAQKKFYNVILMIASKLMVNQ